MFEAWGRFVYRRRRLVLLVAAWILFKVVIGVVAAIAWIVVVVLAIAAIVWAIRVL